MCDFSMGRIVRGLVTGYDSQVRYDVFNFKGCKEIKYLIWQEVKVAVIGSKSILMMSM